MASKLPWTHFFVHADGRITGFVPDTCESCGCDIQAPNSVTLCETPQRLRALGLKESQELPEEAYYDEATDREACYNANCAYYSAQREVSE